MFRCYWWGVSASQAFVHAFGGAGAAVERAVGLGRPLAAESGIDHEYGYGIWSPLRWRRHHWPPSAYLI
jgi:hypothetical protein